MGAKMKEWMRIDDVLGERTCLDATASRASRDLSTDVATGVLDILAVSTQAPIVSVEDG